MSHFAMLWDYDVMVDPVSSYPRSLECPSTLLVGSHQRRHKCRVIEQRVQIAKELKPVLSKAKRGIYVTFEELFDAVYDVTVENPKVSYMGFLTCYDISLRIACCLLPKRICSPARRKGIDLMPRNYVYLYHASNGHPCPYHTACHLYGEEAVEQAAGPKDSPNRLEGGVRVPTAFFSEIHHRITDVYQIENFLCLYQHHEEINDDAK
ncbi:MAG: hypothetical protein LUC85_04470 [Bacteroidales bacterium]|nr:hypothetical protein [Bacteroidales bacterium]